MKNLVGNSADGSAYHGYWTQDINSLNDNFGTEEDLLALSAALHERGMYLMVDVVTNHMAWLGTTDSVDYSVLKPFNSVCNLLSQNSRTSLTGPEIILP